MSTRDNYTNIRDQHLDNKQGASLLGSVGKIALTMVGFGIGTMVSNKVITGITTAAGSALRQTASAARGAAWNTGSVRGFVRQIQGSLSRIERQGMRINPATKNPTLGNILANTDAYRNSGFGRTIARMNTLESRVLYSEQSLKKHKQNAIFHRAKAPYRGRQHSGQVLQARAWRYTKEVAKTAPVFYGLSRLISPHSGDKKPWYSPSAMGSFITNFVPSDILFRGAAPVGRQIMGAIGEKAGHFIRSTKDSSGRDIMQRALGFMDRHRGKSLMALSSAIKETAGSIHPSATGPIPFASRVMKAAQTFGTSYHTARERLVKQQATLRNSDSPVERAAEIINKMSNRAHQQSVIRDITGEKEHARSKSYSAINRLLGFTGKDDPTQDRIRSAITELDGHKLYAGKGFVSYKGERYNISNWSVPKIMEMTVDVAKSFKVFGHTPTDIMNINSIAEYSNYHNRSFVINAGEHVNTGVKLSGSRQNGNWDNYTLLGRMFGDIEPSTIRDGRRTPAIGISQRKQAYTENAAQRGTNILNSRLSHVIDNPDDMRTKMINEMAEMAEHGQYVVGKGERVFNIKGRLYLETQNSTSSVANDLYKMGINPQTGEQLKYTALPLGGSGSVMATAHDKMMDGHTVDENSNNPYHVGYGGPEFTGGNTLLKGAGSSFMGKIMRKFDLGSKNGSPTILNRINKFYKGLRDPLDPYNYSSTTNLLNPQTRRDIVTGSPDVLQTHGRMIGNLLDKVNVYSYGKLFKEDDVMENIVQQMETIKPGSSRMVLTRSRVSDTSQLDDIIKQAQMSAEYTNTDNAALRRVVDKVANIRTNDSNYQVGGKTVFDVIDRSVYGKTTVLDEYNRQMLKNALDTFNNSQLSQLAEGISHPGLRDAAQAGKYLRAFKDSCNPRSNYNDMFKSVTGERSSTEAVGNIHNMLDVISNNQEVFTEARQKAFHIWNVGNSGGMYTTPHVKGVRDHLFIADKFDTAGNLARGEMYGDKVATMSNLLSGTAVESVNNVANVVGLGFSGQQSADMGTFVTNMIFKRALPAAGLMTAWRVADTLADESDMFQGTSLEEGLNVFVSTQFMKARLASARIMDASGFTDFAKQAEDLMPGSMTSHLSGMARGFGAPLVGAAYGMKFFGPAGAAAGGAIGGVFSLLTSGGPLASAGAYDITKNRKELIEEFSGRKKVQYKTDRGWLLGSTPMGGTDVDGWVPSFYSRIRSQYKYTPTVYGSKMDRLLGPLDGSSPESLNYNSRPYPVDKGMFSSKPLIGNLASFGQSMQHEKELEEWSKMSGTSVGGIDTSMFGGGTTMGGSSGGAGGWDGNSGYEYNSSTLQANAAITPGSSQSRVNELYYRSSEFLGMRGFMGQALMQKATGSIVPYDDTTVLANSADMTAAGNWFWDQAFGDPLGITEFIRRFYPINSPGSTKLNPLPNTQANWLPDKYKTGDPYRAISLGEIRLPGAAYESTNDVELTFPGDVDLIGENDFETTANYLFGKRKTAAQLEAESRTKQMIVQQLSASNQMAKEDQTYFDARRDLSGTADVAAGGINYKVQAVSPEEFARLNGITSGMSARLGVLSDISGGKAGAAVYVNTATGETKQYMMTGDQNASMAGLKNLAIGQARAKQLVNNNDIRASMNLGNAYSRMDRYKILTDIAPGSMEHIQAEQQVRALHGSGQYMANYENQMENIARQTFISTAPRKLYPYRFTNMSGNSAEAIERSNQINAEYGAVSRSIGAAWENFSHMNTVVHKKLMDINSPYEAYERNTISGRQIKLWNNPYQHFIKPYVQKVANDTSSISNATSLATTGLVFGGPVGMVLGAIGGASAGALNTSDFNGIPGYRQKERDIDQALDTVEYNRNMQQYKATGNMTYLTAAKKTMTYLNSSPQNIDINTLTKSSPYAEKGYMKALMSTTGDNERAQIMHSAPDMLKPGIQKIWNQSSPNGSVQMSDGARSYLDQIPENWAGYLTENKMDLIKTKIYQSEGLDARDAGVGWHSQISEISRSPYLPDSWNTTVKSGTLNSVQDIAGELRSALGGAQVTATPTLSSQIVVNLTILQ